MVSAAGLCVAIVAGAMFVAGCAGRPAVRPASDPEGAVRAVVALLRAGVTEASAYRAYFAEQEVADAVAKAVESGEFPKGLDIVTAGSQVASDEATVTVLWNMKRPDIEENGSAFRLKREGAKWLIVDASSRQVADPRAGPGAAPQDSGGPTEVPSPAGGEPPTRTEGR